MSWTEFNAIMKNMSGEQLDQQSFQQVYDSDPAVAELVSSFDPDGINFGDKEDPQAGQEPADDTVDNMAQRATANAMS